MPSLTERDHARLFERCECIASASTCRVRVLGAEAPGAVYLESGQPVHAVFGVLVGAQAVHAILSARRVRFEVDSNVQTRKRSIFVGWQQLIDEVSAKWQITTKTAPPIADLKD